MKAKGYCLWLMPTGEAYDKFSSLIKRLAKEYNASVFEPHVTLIGDLMGSENDVLKEVEQLVLGQRSFPITLRLIDYQDFYFRTLFVKADRTKPLQTLHDQACEIFEMKEPNYMPHLSLLYGDFSPKVKEKIIEAIGRDQTTEFTVSSLNVFKTDGEVESWHKVGEFTLPVSPRKKLLGELERG